MVNPGYLSASGGIESYSRQQFSLSDRGINKVAIVDEINTTFKTISFFGSGLEIDNDSSSAKNLKLSATATYTQGLKFKLIASVESLEDNGNIKLVFLLPNSSNNREFFLFTNGFSLINKNLPDSDTSQNLDGANHPLSIFIVELDNFGWTENVQIEAMRIRLSGKGRIVIKNAEFEIETIDPNSSIPVDIEGDINSFTADSYYNMGNTLYEEINQVSTVILSMPEADGYDEWRIDTSHTFEQSDSISFEYRVSDLQLGGWVALETLKSNEVRYVALVENNAVDLHGWNSAQNLDQGQAIKANNTGWQSIIVPMPDYSNSVTGDDLDLGFAIAGSGVLEIRNLKITDG